MAKKTRTSVKNRSKKILPGVSKHNPNYIKLVKQYLREQEKNIVEETSMK